MSAWLSKGFCVLQTFIGAAIFLSGAAVVAAPQAAQAELTGDVRDGSGAGVSKAAVTVTQTETRRSARSRLRAIRA